MSACRSEKPIARSGLSARIASIFALVNAETRGFSRRARGGRTVKPEMPDDAPLFAERVQHLGGLFGQAHDAFGEGGCYHGT